MTQRTPFQEVCTLPYIVFAFVALFSTTGLADIGAPAFVHDSCDSPPLGKAPKENDRCDAKSATYNGGTVKGRCIYMPSDSGHVSFRDPQTTSDNCRRSADGKKEACLYCSYAGSDREIRAALDQAGKDLQQGRFDALREHLVPLHSLNADLEAERVYLVAEALFRQRKNSDAFQTMERCDTIVYGEARLTPVHVAAQLLYVRIALNETTSPRGKLVGILDDLLDFKASEAMWNQLDEGAAALPLDRILSPNDRRKWDSRIKLGKTWAKANYPGTKICVDDDFMNARDEEPRSKFPDCVVPPGKFCGWGLAVYSRDARKLAKLKSCDAYGK